jgi:hypothetical protein
VSTLQLDSSNRGGVAEMNVWVWEGSDPSRVPLERDDLSPGRFFQRVVVRGDAHLPWTSLALGPHNPIVLADSRSKGGAAYSWQWKWLAGSADPGMLAGRAVIAVGRDLRVSDARERELERSEKVLDRFAGSGGSHPTAQRLARERKKHGDPYHFRLTGTFRVSTGIPALDKSLP